MQLRMKHCVRIIVALFVWASAHHGIGRCAGGVEINPAAPPAEAEAARALFQKYGGPRFFGYSGHDPKVLHLLDPALTNDDIAPLAHMASLQEVFIAGIAIDDAGLAPLAALHQLRSLSLSGTGPDSRKLTMPLTGKGFTWLAMLPELEKIWLRDLPVEPEHLAKLARVQGLTDLWISETAMLDGKRQWPAGASANPMLEGIAQLQGLETFRFQTTDKGATAAAFAGWKSAATLKTLVLEGVAIDREGWSSLKNFQALESLSYRAPVGEIDWKVLATLRNLREVHLESIADGALEGIRQCQQIRALHLSQSITDAGLRSVTQMPNLESLALWHSRIDGSGFDDVENLIRLKSVTLDGTQLNDEGLKYAVRLPALEKISFQRTKVTPEGMKALVQAKQTLKQVTPTDPVYDSGRETDNAYYRAAQEIRDSAPEIQFNFSVDAPP